MKILVVKLSAFGDLIHTLSALDDLLARPEVDEVHWLVDERFAFATEVFPPQVKVHSVALKGDAPLHAAWQMIRKLRREHFDAVLDLQGLIKSGLIARAIARPVYGFDRRFSPEWPNRLLVSCVSFDPADRHVVQKYRRIAAAPFADRRDPVPYAPPHIQKNEAIQQAGAAMLAELQLQPQGYTVMHIGGGWQTKQLPFGTWREVIGAIQAEGSTCLLSWGNDAEQQKANELAGVTGATVLPRRLAMMPLCGLLLHARTVIGTDTGLLHLAAALAAPTVTYWGPSASWNSAPLGEYDVQVESNPECGPCFKRECNEFVCLPALKAEAIVQAWREVKI